MNLGGGAIPKLTYVPELSGFHELILFYGDLYCMLY